MQTIITLACSECSSRNYTTTKNKQKNRDKLSLKKYCSKCGRHTVHSETR
ncbi:MAG: 50S ribosomal protein L33 [Armatimonadetes bacterium]|nr:50S ribosomal protein L33 [Armatimonadota bacterium]PIU65055.1 MAG: 50S ribosomal protein L33 [Armatimonadetes bacterium CG07_land_8_20_14_0_80_59_28]PIY43371.1 MAG: 50S ribosomal protein L33 [Armatimonadetes bacterium CG_4_10_14_3_um_filter_59_10]PJB74863.1 MAG: 50S ribosomal protein L33 [Armatimonadetes bacterium CG_4_9_14_3_um_filter_58_7]